MSKTMEIKEGGVMYTVIVDDEDYELLTKHKWHIQIISKIPRVARFAYLHREILMPPPGYQVDHANGNSLDFRKCNLRVCTSEQNAQNRRPSKSGSSKYKGVIWNKAVKRWQAHCRRKCLGRFNNEIEAARAYDTAADAAYAEFAWLNRDHFEELLT